MFYSHNQQLRPMFWALSSILLNTIFLIINPLYADIFLLNHLSPHDALRHHFTSLKTDLIFP